MPKFNPNDYEMVEDRLKKFWKDNPNGRVWTEVIKTSDDGSMVIVQIKKTLILLQLVLHKK